MTGIVNSTGAKSGIIGTTVGTPSGGAMTYLATGSLSSSTDIGSASLFSSTYRVYKIFINHMGMSSSGELRSSFLYGGSATSGSIYDYAVYGPSSNADLSTARSTGTTFIQITHTISESTTTDVSLEITVTTPNETLGHTITGTFKALNSSGYSVSGNFLGSTRTQGTTGVLTGVTITDNNTSINRGNYHLYGIKTS